MKLKSCITYDDNSCVNTQKVISKISITSELPVLMLIINKFAIEDILIMHYIRINIQHTYIIHNPLVTM